MDLVRSIFLPHEAATILKIPISFRLPDDQLVWIGNKRGSFTVKSAYYIAMRMVDDQEFGECSAVHSQTSFWKAIWHLNIPPKIRIFAWRVCKNGLPTMLNLRSRGLNISGFCLLCDKEMKSVQHSLFLCSHAKLTWVNWPDCPVSFSSPNASIMDSVSKFIDSGLTEELALFFTVLWSIWRNRNQAIYGDSAIPPAMVQDSAKRAHLDSVDARLTFPPSPPPACVHQTAPPAGFFKINVDGATGVGGGKSCIGVVIWDSSGFPIGALSLVLPSSFPAETTEAYALLHGVLFAFEMQVHQALFESDALSIIHDLISKVPGSDFGHILEDIRVATSSFSFCSFHHLKRDGNRAAHSLALEAKCSGQSKIWIEIPFPCIQDILSDDLL